MDELQNLNLQNVEKNLDMIYTFLVPCLPLANAHATDFITRQYWNTLLPAGIREQLLTLSKQELGILPCAVLERTEVQDTEGTEGKAKEENSTAEDSLNYTDDKDLKQADLLETDTYVGKQDSLKQDIGISLDSSVGGASNSEVSWIPYKHIDDFLHYASLSTIEGTRLAISSQDLLYGMGGYKEDVFVGTYMNQKKCHEVEIMSKICAALAECFHCKMIVDFGSGKGYLGNHLSLQYQLPVLGIDAAATNTQSAKKRNKVLDKQWSSLARNKVLESDGKKLTKKEKKHLKLKGKNTKCGENILEKEQENLDSSEANLVENIVTKGSDMVEAKSVNKSTEAAFDLSKMNIGKADNIANDGKFIPCTTFIDKETNFINLAKFNFPDLFKEHLNDQPEQSLIDNCCGERKTSPGTRVHNISYVSCDTCDKRSPDDKYLASDLDFNYSMACVCNKRTSTKINDEPRKNIYASKTDEHIAVVGKADNSETDIRIADDNKADIGKTCDNKADDRKAGDSKADIRKDDDDDEITEKINPDVSNIDGEDEDACDNNSTSKTDLSDEFRMMLIGLHTCGNLASTSMEVFVHSDHLKVMCNVGCCYHLLHEQYLDEGNDGIESGFPLSRFLKERTFKLGNTARNLASQSIHRISDIDKLQGERFYPRALLEVLIQDMCGGNIEMKGLRKLEQKCQTTQEYLKRACDKLGIADKVSSDMIEGYVRKYSDDQHKLAAFFQLKTALAPCIESLIILDRICFLLEQEQVENVYLVKMFDPVKSPRCYGIIAVK